MPDEYYSDLEQRMVLIAVHAIAVLVGFFIFY